eukprot:m.296515 g.296515  ORF g.296515 m.296515 type:complete len:873 (+) comp20065_c0_seq2:238-2856(+)
MPCVSSAAVIKNDDTALEDFAHIIIEARFFSPGKALCETSSIDVDHALEDIAHFWRNGDPVALDIVIRAPAGGVLSSSPTSCGRGSDLPTEMIIETWRMELETKPASLKHKPDFLDGPVDAAPVMPASKLLSLALKSFLHFSPVNSWLIKDPSARSRLSYRVHAPYSTCNLERTRQFAPLELEQSQLLLQVNYQQTCPGTPWFCPQSASNGGSSVVVAEVLNGNSNCASGVQGNNRPAGGENALLCPSTANTPTGSPPSTARVGIVSFSSAVHGDHKSCKRSGRRQNPPGVRRHVDDDCNRARGRSACGGDTSPVGAACGNGKRDRPYQSQHFRRPSPMMRNESQADDGSNAVDHEHDVEDVSRGVEGMPPETTTTASPVFLTPQPMYSTKRHSTGSFQPQRFMTPPLSSSSTHAAAVRVVPGEHTGEVHTATVTTVNESKQVGASGYFSSPPRMHRPICLSPDPRKKFGPPGPTGGSSSSSGGGSGGRLCSAPIPIGTRSLGPRAHHRGTPSSLGRSASLGGSGGGSSGGRSVCGATLVDGGAVFVAPGRCRTLSGGSETATSTGRHREWALHGATSPVNGLSVSTHSGSSHSRSSNRHGVSWENGTGGLMAGRNFLGSYEESLLSGRMSHSSASPVAGFVAELGACGAGRTPPHIKLPLPASFYKIPGEDTPSPYVGHVQLDAHPGVLPAGRYRIPVQGLVQLMVYNPERTGTKVFLVKYDLRDMPPKTHTFLRQRTFVEHEVRDSPAGPARTTSRLLYAIHLRFVCTKPGRVYLHKDIRVVFSHRAPDKTEKVKTITEGPKNPSYSPIKKDKTHTRRHARVPTATPDVYRPDTTGRSHDHVQHSDHLNLRHLHTSDLRTHPPPRLSLEV